MKNQEAKQPKPTRRLGKLFDRGLDAYMTIEVLAFALGVLIILVSWLFGAFA